MRYRLSACLLLACLCSFIGPLCQAEVYSGSLNVEGGLRFQVDGLGHFEANTDVTPPSGFGYPIFTSAENESHFLGGFMMGLKKKMYCFGLPIPGKTISVSATFRSHGNGSTDPGAGMTLMITPVKMAYAKSKGEKWAHAIENKIVYREADGAAGQTFSLSASIRYEESWGGVIISIRPSGEDEYGAVTIYVFDDKKETVTVTDVAPDDSGEEEPDGGGKIPWKWLIPGAIIGGGGILIGKGKNKKPKGGKKQPKDKKKEEKKEEEEPSSFQMVLWKNCGSTLTVGDPPVQMGARIEEITPDGRKIDRPDLTRMITINANLPVVVEKKRKEGQYMKADVSVMEDGAEQVTVSFIFNGPSGRLVRRWVFQVESAPAIIVEPDITFAAGQGKTLFMEFALLGALQNPEKLEVKLEKKAAPFFKAGLEKDAERPGVFRVNLTEQTPGKPGAVEDEVMPGTIENYTCTIEALAPGKKTPVSETFTIYRIHLGLRLEVRALKGYLVELESTPDNDIMPPKGSKRRKKYAESRVDWELTVVDEEDGGRIKSVRPDSEPRFTFEDDFEGSTLYVSRDKGNYLPIGGEYDQCFFRTYDGEGIPSPCETLKFEYATVGGMPGGGYWGIIRPTQGYLVSPNRSHVKVKVSMSWRGKVFTREQRVPLNSQPFRKIVVPEGGDFMRELNKWDKMDTERKNQLIDMQRKIAIDTRFAELKPMYYKVSVMLDAHDPAFGFDEEDYQNLMNVWHKLCGGEIGTAFAAKETVAPDDENFEALVATIAAMDRSVPAIACRIGLGIVTGGASEVILTPVSSLVEMKEYVDKGGDSAFEAFAQCSKKVLFWEGVFFVGGKLVKGVGGKVVEKVKQFRAAKAEQAKLLASKAKQLGEGAKKATQTAKVTQALSQRPAFTSTKAADKIVQAGSKAKQAISESKKMADTAVKKTLESGKAAKQLTQNVEKTAQEYADDAVKALREGDMVRKEASLLREKAAQVARKDGEKLVENFRRVAENPAATPDELRRATMALQGNKTAQEVLKGQSSDFLRAKFNQQMQQLYDDIDPKVIKRLQQKIKVRDYVVEEPEIRVFKGATGNAGDELALGRKIGADRDVTYQMWDKQAKKWVDLSEDIMEEAYSEAINLELYGTLTPDRAQLVKTMRKLDQAVVNGALGKESYGIDLQKIINPARQTEKLADPERIAQTYIHKCKEWMQQGKEAHEVAYQLLKKGFEDEAVHVLGYSEALIKEGMRQNVKQFKRILVPRIEAAAAKGIKLDYTKLMAKIRILESISEPPPKGAVALSLEEARLILKNHFGSTLESVVEECGQAVMDVNKVL